MRRKSRNRRAEVKKQKKIILIVGIVCACLLAGIAISYFSLRGYVNRTGADTINNHIFIGSVDVSGMKKTEAKKALEKQVKKYQAEKISLQVEKESVEVSLAELGFKIKEVDKLVEDAVDYGKKEVSGADTVKSKL